MSEDLLRKFYKHVSETTPDSIMWTDTKSLILRVEEAAGYGKVGYKYNLYFISPNGLIQSIPIDEQTVVRKVFENGNSNSTSKVSTGHRKEESSKGNRARFRRLFGRNHRFKRG